MNAFLLCIENRIDRDTDKMIKDKEQREEKINKVYEKFEFSMKQRKNLIDKGYSDESMKNLDDARSKDLFNNILLNIEPGV